MRRPVRIGITGTHSTGKSDFLDQLAAELRAAGRDVARTPPGLASTAAGLGFPKLQQHTAESTEWIMATGAAAEVEAALYADIVLIDRAAPDALAYYRAALEARNEEPDPLVMHRLLNLSAIYGAGYTLLIATVLDPDVPLGAHRDRDPHFRAGVDRHIHRLLAEHGIPHIRLENTAHSHRQAIKAALATTATPTVPA